MQAYEAKSNLRSPNAADMQSHTVFASAFWLGLSITAGFASIWSGLDYVRASIAVCVAIIPVMINLIFGRSSRHSELVDIWVVFAWLGVSLAAISFSGASTSPLAILLAMGPLHALAAGRYRLGIEASVFSAVGYLAIAGLQAINFPLPSDNWLGSLAGLGALISVLQIGAFISAARTNFSEQQQEKAALSELEETLSDSPILVMKLSAQGRVRSWFGDDGLLGTLGTKDLKGRSVTGLFENSRDIREADGTPMRLKLLDASGAIVESRLVRTRDGFRMVLSRPAGIPDAILDELKALEKDGEDIEARLKAQAQWVASLGHELRNMLNPVGGYSDLILSERAGPVEEPYKEFARSIKQGAEHLGMLVDDLMTASKSQAGHLRLSAEEVDIRLEIEDAIKLMAWQAEAHDVSVLLMDGADMLIEADRKALRQILINLLGNAIKYSHPKGRVTVSLHPKDDVVRIDIRDQGEGMEADELARIGEAFFQGENAKGRAGTGLGLSIVHLLTHALNGEVNFESEPGKGTLAQVTLPKANDSLKGPEAPKAAEAS